MANLNAFLPRLKEQIDPGIQLKIARSNPCSHFDEDTALAVQHYIHLSVTADPPRSTLQNSPTGTRKKLYKCEARDPD